MRCRPAILCLAVALTTLPGCGVFDFLIRNGGDTAYEVDGGNFGTGEPVVRPADRPGYWNGQPMDMRSH